MSFLEKVRTKLMAKERFPIHVPTLDRRVREILSKLFSVLIPRRLHYNTSLVTKSLQPV